MLNVKMLSSTVDPELIIATAAKLCYSPSTIEDLKGKQTPEKVEKFIKLLASLGHESPIEHVSFTFGVEGISRVTEIQLLRHRLASYSVKSGRYVRANNFNYVIPPMIKRNEELLEKYVKGIERDWKEYNELVDGLIIDYILENESDFIQSEVFSSTSTLWLNKIDPDENWAEFLERFKEKHGQEYFAYEKQAIEDARYKLPIALETKLVVTMNARSLMNLFRHRCCFRAQWEIRAVANEILKICKKEAPTLFKNAGAPCKSGICSEGKMQCKELKGKIPTMVQIKEILQKDEVKKLLEEV